jgi:hypothetical protein
MSLDCEREKRAIINTTQMSNAIGTDGSFSRRVSRVAWIKKAIQGKRPPIKIGIKNHRGW